MLILLSRDNVPYSMCRKNHFQCRLNDFWENVMIVVEGIIGY